AAYENVSILFIAPKKVKVIGNETKVEVDLKPNQDVEGTVEIYTVAQVTVITANVTCGEVELFASAETSTPSEVFYDVKGEARDNDPASFSIKNRGRTVFVHYIGKLVTTMEYCKTRTNTFSMFSITFSQAIDECERSPCKNDGTCVDLPRGFTCQCASGYTGRSCEDEVNMCESSPCQNHGTCSKNGNGYRCYCAFGFSGRHCEVNIDDCAPNPCRNGGSCSDLVNNFHCSCPNGYTGKACNVIVNHCRSSSCQNGGSCISSPSGFSCYCQTGYTGSNCETGIVQPSNSISMCIPKGNIYHIPYPKDKTKFIQCDEFGGSFVMPCAPGTQFNKDYQTCVSRKTAECPRAGYQTFADPLNPGRFYQCSNGVPYLKSCPGGLVFDDNYKICTWSTRKRQETENSDLIDDDDKRNNDNNSFDDDDDDDAMESERELEESKLDNTYEKKRRGNLEKLKEVVRNFLD
ncbi:neurogenic locus notch homolog protein 2-like, partial [Saccostrea cucullata]|uniref:neurogenic locus notch homolog protein 2-like n=2 Tax=Saccostrea cuccullata TaxID=36930 RepID=UPI002ED4D751